MLKLVAHLGEEEGEVRPHVETIKLHDVVEVDGLEVLFHLGVLFLERDAVFFFGFFVVFVDEVVEFDALGVGCDNLSVLGLEEELDAADNGGFDFKIWVQSLVCDTELP
jgi:hypothetical protein